MTDEIEFFSTTVLCVRADGLVLGAARRGLVPDNWGLPGGKIDEGEDAVTAATREVFEETGVSVILDPTPLFWGPDTGSSGEVRYCVTFLATEFSGSPQRQDGEGNAGWVTWQDLFAGVFSAYNTELHRVWSRNPRTAVCTPQATADDLHRARCWKLLGHGRCICATYAAVTGCLHPDCPQHGYVTGNGSAPT